MRFDMKKTTCAKAEHGELSELCAPDDQNVVNMRGNKFRLEQM